MSDFDISTLFDRPDEPTEVNRWYHSAAEAMKDMRRKQILDIIWPQRPIHRLIKHLDGEVVLRYKTKNDKVVETELAYYLPREKRNDFINCLWLDNLPEMGIWLIVADFWIWDDISIFQKSESEAKEYIDSQWIDENFIFFSKKYPYWYKKEAA